MGQRGRKEEGDETMETRKKGGSKATWREKEG